MEEKYIDLVINRLTQKQYDDLKKNNQIKEEEIYDIIDHDSLFYYQSQLYTRSEIDNKLESAKNTVRSEFSAADTTLSGLISTNTSNISANTSAIESTNSDLSTFKTNVETNYATKQELEEFSPVVANPDITPETPLLGSIKIDEIDYNIYPEGKVEFSNILSTDVNAVNLRSLKIGNDTWNIPMASIDDLTEEFYTKDEVDTKLQEIDVSGQLVDYAKTADVYTKTQIDNKGFLTEHQSLDGYATETYVNTKVSDLINSAPDALNTLNELSAALGNDPNFATTVITQINTKANSADVYTKNETDLAIITAIENLEIPDVSGQLTDYAKKSEIPTKVSQLTNDRGYLTSHQSLSHLETKTDASLKLTEAKSYTDTKLRELIGTSPETLDTIYEIAEALEGQDDVITGLETSIANKANKSDVYTKTEIDSREFTNVSANPELSGDETVLSSVSIKGVNYKIEAGGAQNVNTLTLSTEPIDGAEALKSITINGDSWNIVGEGGNSTIDPTVFENYYTKEEVDTAISGEVSKVIGAAPEAYNTLKEISDYIESDLSNAAAMTASINAKANSVDVYSKSEANSKFALKSDIPEDTDLSNYYTKDETLAVIDTISGLDNYYSKSEIDSKVETINASKQDALVSGTNIKTINGLSILGQGNIMVSGGEGGGGSLVEANPVLTGDEQELTSIGINNVNYAVPNTGMLFSEAPVAAGNKTLKTIYIEDDVWSIEKGSSIVANIPLSGDEEVLDSVLIDDVPYTLKGEEMLFYEQELADSVPLKTIVINGDKWYVGGVSEETVDAKISALVDGAPDTLNTLKELATALQDNSEVLDALNSSLTNKADKTEIIRSYNNLTDKPEIPNIVYSESEPENPVEGMIWLKPLI